MQSLIDTIQTRETQNGNIELYQDLSLDQMQIEDETRKLNAFNHNFQNAITQYIINKKSTTELIHLGETPLSLIQAGIPNQTVAVKYSVLKKAMDGKHDLTEDQMKQIPEAFYNPVMIFESSAESTNEDGYVVLTEINDKNNKPIVIALNVAKKDHKHIVTDIASIHKKDNGRSIEDWINQGLLRYIHKKRALKFALSRGLQLPKGVTLNKNSSNTILDNSQKIKLNTENNSNILNQTTAESKPTANGLTQWRNNFNAWRKTPEGQPLEYCRFARDNHVKLKPPTPNDGAYYRSLWLGIPSDLKGTKDSGFPLDIFHRDLELAGFNVENINPLDLLESMQKEYQIQLETYSNMNKLSIAEEQAIKETERFYDGKTSEHLPHTTLAEILSESPFIQITFTRMGETFTVKKNDKLIAESNTEIIDLSNPNSETLIDTGSLNVNGINQRTPKMRAGTRGAMVKYDDIYNIVLMQNADVSTVIHELNHVYYSVLEDMVNSNTATVETRNMYYTINMWAEKQIPDELVSYYLKFKENLNAITSKVYRDAVKDYASFSENNSLPPHALESAERFLMDYENHTFNSTVIKERFARANEKYLMTGTAPSNKLKSVFRKVRNWMIELYLNAKSLNVELSPEINSVFAQMYATQAEIERKENSLDAQIERLSQKYQTTLPVAEKLLKLSKEIKDLKAHYFMEIITAEINEKLPQQFDRLSKEYENAPGVKYANWIIENGQLNSQELLDAHISESQVLELENRKLADPFGAISIEELKNKTNSRPDLLINQMLAFNSKEEYVNNGIQTFTENYTKKRIHEIEQPKSKESQQFDEEHATTLDEKLKLIKKFIARLQHKEFDKENNKIVRTIAKSQMAELTIDEATNTQQFLNKYRKFMRQTQQLLLREDFEGAESANLVAQIAIQQYRIANNLKTEIIRDGYAMRKRVWTMNREVGKTIDGKYVAAILRIFKQLGIINNDLKNTPEYNQAKMEGKDPLRLIEKQDATTAQLLGETESRFDTQDEDIHESEVNRQPSWCFNESLLKEVDALTMEEYKQVKDIINELYLMGRVQKGQLRTLDKNVDELAELLFDEISRLKNINLLGDNTASKFVAEHNTVITLLKRIAGKQKKSQATEILYWLSDAQEKEYSLLSIINTKMKDITQKLNEINVQFDTKQLEGKEPLILQKINEKHTYSHPQNTQTLKFS